LADPAAGLRRCLHGCAFSGCEGQWLLDEDVQAHAQSGDGEVVVDGVGCGDDDRIEACRHISVEVCEIGRMRHAMGCAEGSGPGGRRVDDGREPDGGADAGERLQVGDLTDHAGPDQRSTNHLRHAGPRFRKDTSAISEKSLTADVTLPRVRLG